MGTLSRLSYREVGAWCILDAEVTEQVPLSLVEADDRASLQSRLFLLYGIPPGSSLSFDDGGLPALSFNDNIGSITLSGDVRCLDGVVGLILIG